MAVNRQFYVTTGYTVSDAGCIALANTFRQMFIDAGLMSEWHDSYSSANSNGGTTHYRVLKLTQNANKTYGSTYVLFTFYYGAWYGGYGGIYVNTSTDGWNATSHVPTGTQYLDWFSTTGGDYGRSGQAAALWASGGTTTDFIFVRYTVGSTTIIHCPGRFGPMIFQSPIETQPSWVDLDKVNVPSFLMMGTAAGGYGDQYRLFYFYWPTAYRRMVFPGRTPYQTTSGYYNNRVILNAYSYGGNSRIDDANDPSGGSFSWAGAYRLPWSDGSLIPSASSPWGPILTGIDMALPLNLKLPSDFAISVIPSRTAEGSALSRIKISDSEVWEIITRASTPNATNSMVLLARVV